MAKKTAKKAPRKKAPKKKAVIATRRSTAGTGFDFEDFVAAWLLLQALAGRDIPVHGQAKLVQMQTSSLGWDIDDVLFTTQGQAGDQRLAISCKGNVQVSANGLPLSFAEQAWRLWTKAGSPFNRATDVMALATLGAHTRFQSAWSDIKKIASGADPSLAMAQITTNPRYDRIVGGLKAAAADAAVADADVLSLIGRVEVLPFDFQQAQSKDERDAIAVARSLLSSATQQDAKRLWADIVSSARETRLGNGTLDIAALLRWLRQRFTLKDLPDYEPSWARLRALSTETESVIQTALPSGARLDFRSDSDLLLAELGTKPCLVVYGELVRASRLR